MIVILLILLGNVIDNKENIKVFFWLIIEIWVNKWKECIFLGVKKIFIEYIFKINCY